MQNIKNLDGLAVISIDLDIWSGQTKLQDIDLRLADEYNQEVVNLGNKRLVSRDSLKPFERLKSTVRRNMLRRGIQFLNGYAVPVEQLDETIGEIEGLKKQFESEVAGFLATYHGNVEAWITQNPADEEVIRRGTLPIEAVEKRFGFAWDAFQVQGVNNASAQRQLDSTAGQLGNKLIEDVQTTARDFWDRNLRGRAMVGITCQATLREMKRKLESLAFLDSRSRPLIALLDRVIQQSERAESRTGRNFVDPFFSQLVASVLILADRSRMQEYLDGYHELPSDEKDGFQDELFAVMTAKPQAEDVTPELEAAPEVEAKPAAGAESATAARDAFFNALEEMAGLHGAVDIEVPAPSKQQPADAPEKQPVATNDVLGSEAQPIPAAESEPQEEVREEATQETKPAEADFGFGFNSTSAVGWN